MDLVNKGINDAVFGAGAVLFSKNVRNKDDESRAKLMRNNEFPYQMLCENIPSSPKIHTRYWAIADSGNNYYFIFRNRATCSVCDYDSHIMVNIIKKRPYLGGEPSFTLTQGSREIGTIVPYLYGNINSNFEFNGWRIIGNSDQCDIYDRYKRYIAEIKSGLLLYKVHEEYKKGRRSREMTYRRAYVINYLNPLYEVMSLVSMVMIHWSAKSHKLFNL